TRLAPARRRPPALGSRALPALARSLHPRGGKRGALGSRQRRMPWSPWRASPFAPRPPSVRRGKPSSGAVVAAGRCRLRSAATTVRAGGTTGRTRRSVTRRQRPGAAAIGRRGPLRRLGSFRRALGPRHRRRTRARPLGPRRSALDAPVHGRDLVRPKRSAGPNESPPRRQRPARERAPTRREKASPLSLPVCFPRRCLVARGAQPGAGLEGGLTPGVKWG